MDDDLFTETTDDESGLFPGSAGDLPTPNLRLDPTMPLAARMRPRDLSEYVGQGHILGEGKLLRRAIEADRFTSLIFYGPPGVGKTSLAELIARRTESRFINLSGVESNVAEIRRAVETARQFQRTRGEITTLFVDEIHRFNKSQQDVLLPHIERGTVRFIGATTHNPYFYINSPLVSRSQVFQLEPLTPEDLAALLKAAVSDPERGFGKKPLIVHEDAARHLVTMCDGDARKLLTSFELAVVTTGADEVTGDIVIDLEVAEDSIQRKSVVYDA
ncbi:MAG TPA: AAA family ATPase, partial [Verrucomicrobiales bacterium]|nr:AAA family ATPase [Verrucomicrobiales bacterium]